jgi:hypothetical protein
MRTFSIIAAAAALVAGPVVTAEARTVFATEATIVEDGPRGSRDGRDEVSSALGDDLDTFFELGFGGVVDFTFGVLARGEINVVEVSSSPRPQALVEEATVSVGLDGVFTEIGTATALDGQAPEGFVLNSPGLFDTVRLTDISPIRGGATSGGFDVARISVAAIPLPATGAALLAGLGALTLLRRRR